MDLLSSSIPSCSTHAALVEQFKELKARNWQTSIHHIYREANYAANHLANLGHSFDLCFHVFDVPFVCLQHWLRFDLFGAYTPRLIPNNI
ncbi:Putative ribonuclease H protein At1g65750 [Linum perenne]